MNKPVTIYLQELKQWQIQLISQLIAILLVTMLTIWTFFSTSKRNRQLESKLKNITGKKYLVRILDAEQPNGFCFGGIGSSIFLTTELIKIMNEREVIAVCLHEIGHITNFDTVKSLGVFATSAGGAGFVGFTIFKNIEKQQNKISYGSMILRFFGAAILIYLIMKTPGLLLGKIHEYRADRYSVQYGYGKDLITALNKLEKWIKEYKFKIYGTPTKFDKAMDKLSHFLDVHPETKDRVQQLFSDNELYEQIHKKNISGIKNIIHKYIS
jgi:Zn-dependent protease with chaperone function